MRWLTVAGVLLYLTRCNDAGALKCHPGSQDPLCALEKKEISEPLPCKPHPNFKGLCSPKHNIVKRSPEEQCTPGTSFKRDCNTCHCLSDGKIACTKKGCVHLTSKRKREAPEAHFIIKRSVCKPNSEFNVECNPCKCAANGLSYTCTHNECLEGDETNKEVEVFMETEGMDHIEQHSVCKPRATFYVGCNTCRCNFIGTDYSCTNKPCPLPKDVEIFHELKDMKPIIPYTEMKNP